MNKFIIITSIFEPTFAVRKFSEMEDYSLIVVGDKKSPQNYHCEKAKFLSAHDKYGFELENVLPFNHYCRKMIGYLYAIEHDADIIAETDDDNIPLKNWEFPDFTGDFDYIGEDNGFVNMYRYFTSQKVWPRGLPLNLINKKVPDINAAKTFNIGVWQGLADGDPDVDAIYRLIDNTPCYFNQSQAPIVLSKGSICPFNTQNTVFRKELFPLLYLPSTVTFRFTDILKGLVAQPIMWNYGYNLGFITANVLQERNEHDYMKDFESEIPCYISSTKVVDIVMNVINSSADIYENLYRAYEGLYKNNIVKEDELKILSAWINDCKKFLDTRHA